MAPAALGSGTSKIAKTPGPSAGVPYIEINLPPAASMSFLALRIDRCPGNGNSLGPKRQWVSPTDGKLARAYAGSCCRITKIPFRSVNRSPGYAAIAASSATWPTATLADAAITQRMCWSCLSHFLLGTVGSSGCRGGWVGQSRGSPSTRK